MIKYKFNNKGYILLETILVVMILSILCVSLANITYEKIRFNKTDNTNQQLYLSAKSALTTITTYFEIEENKGLLKKYVSANNFSGSNAEFSISDKTLGDKVFVEIALKSNSPTDKDYAKITVKIIDINGNTSETYCYMKFL